MIQIEIIETSLIMPICGIKYIIVDLCFKMIQIWPYKYFISHVRRVGVRALIP